jgi:hypothetical protein
MRAVLFGIALAFGLAIAVPAPVSVLDVSSTAIAAGSSSTVAAADFQPEGKDLKVDINVNRGTSGGRWYANPVWMAIGGLAVLVLLVLIVMAVRGGGTTIVKE